MSHPYRDGAEKSPEKVEVETNDVQVTIYYLDHEGETVTAFKDFKGNPSARRNSMGYVKSSNPGFGYYRDWINGQGASNCVRLDYSAIPWHRVLEIKFKIKPRTEMCEVKA